MGKWALIIFLLNINIHAEDFQPRILVCHPKDIVSSIRNRDFIVQDSSIHTLHIPFHVVVVVVVFHR